MAALPRLLIFNLVTDADDPILGFTTDWINALAARCGWVDVITMRTGRVQVADNVRVYSVGKERGYSEPRRAWEFYRLLLSLLRQHHYTACFAHMQQLFAVMSWPLLKLWGVPITLWYAHKATGPLLVIAEKLVDHIVTASPESFRLPSRKMKVIGHGVDSQRFQRSEDSPADPWTLLSVSRIAPVKRLDVLIDGLHLLHQRGLTRTRLRIVGSVDGADQPYAQQLQAQALRLGLMDAVTFAGAVQHHQVAGEYQQAAIMVNLSATGAVDKAVLEAMACETPVITANEAFQTLLARWGDQLLLDAPTAEALADRTAALLEQSPEQRQQLGAELRQAVLHQHSLNRLADTLIRLWRTRDHLTL